MVDTAAAGDFGVYKQREAARIAMTIKVYGEADESPYEQLLGLLPELLTNVSAYRSMWEADDARLSRTEELIDRGRIAFEERPELDLALIRASEDLGLHLSEWHDFALHNRTERTRLLVIQGRDVEFRYRYESWVQFQSRRVLPRVDLVPLAEELNQMEEGGSQWVFEGVGSITPSLHLEGDSPTSIEPDAIIQRLTHHLRTGAAAWNPYS
jgi:hypothetical protein